MLDAIVIGSGPNGFAAGITLARANKSVLIVEAKDTIGGGVRSGERTLPDFIHDYCSTIHAFGPISPFFRSLPLHEHGLEWVTPDIPLAHPLDDGSAATITDVLQPPHPDIVDDILSPLHFPKHPVAYIRFGFTAMKSVNKLAGRFNDHGIKALLAGLGAHSMLPLHKPFSSAAAVALAYAAHTSGWPITKGGAQNLSRALAVYFTSLGGTIETKRHIMSLKNLPASRAVLFDTSPRQLCDIAGDQLPEGFKKRLKKFRHGPGVCKLDWALSGPIPWKAPECKRAGTIHVGGSFDEIVDALRAPWDNRHSEKPFVILAQQSLFDSSRAPAGKHTAWGYCHVPPGSDVDMTDRMERQIERFAPGFQKIILARHVTTAAEMERYNPNYIGGDIGGGAMLMGQLLARPIASLTPYATPNPRLFLCSASTPPAGGVHGMCGFHAANAVLRRVLND